MPVTTRTKRWLFTLLAMTISLGLPMPAFAHGLFDAHLLDRAPLLLTALLVAAAWLLYLLGGRKVPPRRHEALCFHAAMLLVVFSVFGPIDDWAETSTAWHMTQHMLFIIVIARCGRWRDRCRNGAGSPAASPSRYGPGSCVPGATPRCWRCCMAR